jgi:porin
MTQVAWRAMLFAPIFGFAIEAQAQIAPSPAPNPEALVPAVPAPVPPPLPAIDVSQHILGDWGGFLTRLDNMGIDPTLSYLSETSANVSGGIKTGVDYADQRAFGLNIDWDKLAGIPGLQTKALVVNRAGRAVGTDYVGDNLLNENEIQGGAGDVAIRMAYIYGIETLAGGALSIGVGRLSEGLIFNSSPIYCSFLSFGLCPANRGITGGSSDAYTMSPGNVWGGYVRIKPGFDLYATLGAFEAGGTNGGRSGFNWSTSRSTGVTIPVELGFEPGSGGPHPAHLKAGFYYTTVPAADVFEDVNGDAIALTGLPPKIRDHHISEWVAADFMLLRHGSGGNNGLVAFLNYVHNDESTSTLSDLAFFGLEDSGLIASRPADSFGVQFEYAHPGSNLQQTQELLAAQALALGAPAIYPQTEEYVLEAQYDAHVFNGVDVQPDLQYVIRPNATSQYHDALVLSLRLILEL